MSPHDRKSPYFEVLRDVLDNYFWFIRSTMSENPTDIPEHRHEIIRKSLPITSSIPLQSLDKRLCSSPCSFIVLHYSRVYSSQMKKLYIDHGADEDEVAIRALWQVIDCYAYERKEAKNYYAELRQLEFKKDSEEYRKYGHWIIAEGYGRDYQQAAYLALSIMYFKESNSLLWINEAYNLPKELAHRPWTGIDRDCGINYFSESDKRALRKDMEKNKVPIPNILRSGEKVEPVIKKTESMKSMKALWRNYSPFGSPKEEKKSFISSADSSGSYTNVTSMRGNSGLSLFRSRRGSRDATHSQNASRASSPSSRRGSTTGESKKVTPQSSMNKLKTSHPNSSRSSVSSSVRSAREDKDDGLVMKEPSKSNGQGSRPTSQQIKRLSHAPITRPGSPIIEE
ncbi:hypothetical protein ACEPAG_7828 [Sanghuangporus baumii]